MEKILPSIVEIQIQVQQQQNNQQLLHVQIKQQELLEIILKKKILQCQKSLLYP